MVQLISVAIVRITTITITKVTITKVIVTVSSRDWKFRVQELLLAFEASSFEV